jgi:hypothetical protein
MASGGATASGHLPGDADAAAVFLPPPPPPGWSKKPPASLLLPGLPAVAVAVAAAAAVLAADRPFKPLSRWPGAASDVVPSLA